MGTQFRLKKKRKIQRQKRLVLLFFFFLLHLQLCFIFTPTSEQMELNHRFTIIWFSWWQGLRNNFDNGTKLIPVSCWLELRKIYGRWTSFISIVRNWNYIYNHTFYWCFYGCTLTWQNELLSFLLYKHDLIYCTSVTHLYRRWSCWIVWSDGWNTTENILPKH